MKPWSVLNCECGNCCGQLRVQVVLELYMRTVYIAGHFRGAKYLWFPWLITGPRIFYLRLKRPYLPLPAVQAATTKIITHELTNNYC